MGDPGRPRRVFISTGEVSGDLQGMLLVRAMRSLASQRGIALDISALGGQRMAAENVALVGDTTTIGSVGVFEALPYLLPTLGIQRRAKAALRESPPDLAILIDYMTPNLAMGKYLKTHLPQVPVVYYIAPQQWVWAFSEKDTHQIVANTDRMVAIFPEEAEYFRRFGANVTWVGHPLVDQFPTPAHPPDARQILGLDPAAQVVALLPASRKQEIKYLLPVILEAAQLVYQRCPQVQFLLPLSSPELRPALEDALARYELPVRLIVDQPKTAIAAADVCLTKSGTANLEIALMGIPQVVAYRINPLSAWVVRHIFKFNLAFVSPVNLAVNRGVVPEFIQWQATPEALAQATLDLLIPGDARDAMLADYAAVREALGTPGCCQRAATLMLDLLAPAPAEGEAPVL